MSISADIILDLCVETARSFVTLAKVTEDQEEPPTSRLIFPRYRSGQQRARISEQEARQVLCHLVATGKREHYYSVETPTAKRYNFRGALPRLDAAGQSGMTDVSLFKRKGGALVQAVNIELKAHNVAPTQITKDFLKLIAEPVPGVFFHALETTNRGTLPSLAAKYTDAMTKVAPYAQPDADWYLLFAVCVMSPRRILLARRLDGSQLEMHREQSSFRDFFGDFSPPNWTLVDL